MSIHSPPCKVHFYTQTHDNCKAIGFLCTVKKAYIMPALACLTFLLGSVCIMLPFLPFGWALYGVTALILMPYLPPLRKFYIWLAAKDQTGTATKIGYKIAVLYRWSEKTELARKVVDTLNEAEDNGKAETSKKKSPDN